MSQKLRHMELFAGAGGGILGAKLAGLSTRCAVEIEPFRRETIQRRIRDGYLPRMIVRRRVEGIEMEEWRGKIDVVAGGFPCQDISAAGRGRGIENGQKSGLWREFRRVVCELRPFFVFVENSPRLTVKGLGIVLGDLAAMGYDAEWQVLSAAECGAPHLRRRMWILAMERRPMADDLRGRLEKSFKASGLEKRVRAHADERELSAAPFGWPCEPELGRVADGVANRVDRISAIGAGQVPRVYAVAFWGLLNRLMNESDEALSSLGEKIR